MKKHFLKIVFSTLIIIVSGLMIFKDEIMESKYAKTKMEIFKTMQTKDVSQWQGEINNVIDSLLIENDSLEVQE